MCGVVASEAVSVLLGRVGDTVKEPRDDLVLVRRQVLDQVVESGNERSAASVAASSIAGARRRSMLRPSIGFA